MTSTSGKDQSSTPVVRSWPSLCREARAIATMPPKMAARPDAESSRPTPLAPVWRISHGHHQREHRRGAGDHRLGTPQHDGDQQVLVARDRAEARGGLGQEALGLLRGLLQDSRRPARVAASCPGALSADPWTRMPETISIDSRNDAALKRNTSSTSATASRPAPIAGPTKIARLSRVLAVPFEAVSSSGVRASCGVMAPWAARNDEPPKEVSAASAKIGHAGVPAYRQIVASDDQDGAVEVAGHHHPLAGIPVGEGRDERRRERHQGQPDGREDADGLRAPHAVRPDGDGRGVGPVADQRSRERQLEAAQVAVDEHRLQRAAGLAEERRDDTPAASLPTATLSPTHPPPSTSSPSQVSVRVALHLRKGVGVAAWVFRLRRDWCCASWAVVGGCVRGESPAAAETGLRRGATARCVRARSPHRRHGSPDVSTASSALPPAPVLASPGRRGREVWNLEQSCCPDPPPHADLGCAAVCRGRRQAVVPETSGEPWRW